jgi:hypothetical protein
LFRFARPGLLWLNVVGPTGVLYGSDFASMTPPHVALGACGLLASGPYSLRIGRAIYVLLGAGDRGGGLVGCSCAGGESTTSCAFISAVWAELVMCAYPADFDERSTI